MITPSLRVAVLASVLPNLLVLCTAFAEEMKSDASSASASIETLAQKGLWEGVLATATSELKNSPTNPRLLLWQVRAYRMTGKFAVALALSEKALASAPTPELLTEQAWIHAHMGAWQKCFLAGEGAAKLKPDALEPLLVQMIACREMAQWDRCRTLVGVAENLVPNDPAVLMMKGRCLEAAEKWPDAAAVFSQVATLKPDCAEAYYHRGLIFVRMRESAKALEDFSQAIKLQPYASAPYVARAELQEQAGEIESAAADATLAIELGSRQSRPYLILARIAALGGDWALASDAAGKAIELGAGDAATYCLLGQAQRERGFVKEALKSFNRAMELDLHSQRALLERAATHAVAANYPQVIADCTQALAAKPVAMAYAMRGFARLKQKEYDLAFEDSNNAVSLEPREVTGLLVRASVSLAWKNHGDALRDCAMAQRMAPQLAWTHVVYGQALNENGQLEAALKQYERAGQLAPEDAEAPLGQGRVLAAMGKREEAVAAFEKAVTLDPSLKAELAPEIERLRNGKGPQGGNP